MIAEYDYKRTVLFAEEQRKLDEMHANSKNAICYDHKLRPPQPENYYSFFDKACGMADPNFHEEMLEIERKMRDALKDDPNDPMLHPKSKHVMIAVVKFMKLNNDVSN